jgi:murein DD-endopeptidase MepM/ murein hydrolase activator NlpD
MPVFPLSKKNETYKTNASLKFDAPRSNGTRKHAGVDLAIGAGSPVYAIAGGTVIEAANTGFLVRDDKPINVGVVSIKHNVRIKIGETEYDEFVVRYGEVDTVKISVNNPVDEGAQIASIAKQADEGTQLHVELYLGNQGITSSSKFRSDKKPYMRAFTPTDPAAFLESLNAKP